MFRIFVPAEPGKRKRSPPPSTGVVAAARSPPAAPAAAPACPKPKKDISKEIENLEKSRSNERIRFKRCIDAANDAYVEISTLNKQGTRLKSRYRKEFKGQGLSDQEARERGAKKARKELKAQINEAYDVIVKLGALTWREQIRGPTTSKSWSVVDKSPLSYNPLWIVYTPPKERNITDENIERTLNYSDDHFLVWGLPRNKSNIISLDREEFAQWRLVYVIEKYMVEINDKKMTQHRIKGLYVIFDKIVDASLRLHLVRWNYYIKIVLKGGNVPLPAWLKLMR
tara:strand:- start:666 stop:1517 length:852 start_codon:yes stop_codon:yes gene_type:complete